MIRFEPLPRGCSILLSIIGAFLVWVGAVHADVLSTNDGRTFEGTVISDQEGTVQFDTVVSGIKARLSFQRAKVKSIEKKPLSPSAVEAEAIDPGTSEAADAAAPNPYLEIPVKGRLKEQVFTQAIRSSLAYAKLHKIRHVVFVIDSPGGAVDEAGAIYRTLKVFEKDIDYHAIIMNCTGEALVIPFLCKTIHLQPGATVGGSIQKMEHMPARFAKKDEELVRSQIAEELAAEARNRGRKGDIIRAMVDPPIELAAWVNPDGEIEQGRRPPAGIAPDRVIFADGPDTVLVFSYEQATRLGLPGIEGGADALGPLLGLANWQEESSQGRDAMNKAVADRKRIANTAQARFEDAVSRNIRMRETTNRAIQTNLKQAATWNPTSASYEKLSQFWRLQWSADVPWDVQLWTAESRAKWRNRSEACASFLTKARDAINTMIRLEKEAVTLGLSPTFKEGELQLMLDDVNVKVEMLSRNANKVGE